MIVGEMEAEEACLLRGEADAKVASSNAARMRGAGMAMSEIDEKEARCRKLWLKNEIVTKFRSSR